MGSSLSVRSFVGIVFALSAGAAAFAPAAGEQIVFFGVLDGPTVNSPSEATGIAILTLDTTLDVVAYEITYERLQGVEFEAHFHAGPAGAFSPPIHHLPLGTPKIGTWEPTPRRLAELYAGEISVVIHTDLFPEGEIGGWVAAETTPVQGAAWAQVKTLFR